MGEYNISKKRVWELPGATPNQKKIMKFQVPHMSLIIWYLKMIRFLNLYLYYIKMG